MLCDTHVYNFVSLHTFCRLFRSKYESPISVLGCRSFRWNERTDWHSRLCSTYHGYGCIMFSCVLFCKCIILENHWSKICNRPIRNSIHVTWSRISFQLRSSLDIAKRRRDFNYSLLIALLLYLLSFLLSFLSSVLFYFIVVCNQHH